MEEFDSKPYCEGAVKFAEQFGKSFSYKPEDIDDMEEILEILYNDYNDKKITIWCEKPIPLGVGWIAHF